MSAGSVIFSCDKASAVGLVGAVGLYLVLKGGFGLLRGRIVVREHPRWDRLISTLRDPYLNGDPKDYISPRFELTGCAALWSSLVHIVGGAVCLFWVIGVLLSE